MDDELLSLRFDYYFVLFIVIINKVFGVDISLAMGLKIPVVCCPITSV